MGSNRVRKQQRQEAKSSRIYEKTHTETVKQKYGFNGTREDYGYKSFNLSPAQKRCIEVIENNTITFIEALAGAGKSLCALHYATTEYLADPTKRIIVVRTPMEATVHDKVGFLPSELKDKLEPHFASSKMLLESLLSPGKVEADLGGKHQRIQFLIPNFILGATIDNAILIIDEAQTLHPMIMKLLLERIGENTKCIVLGDPSQVYSSSKDRQGMRDAIHRFFNVDGNTVKNPIFENIGYFKFDIEHCMRSDIVKSVLKAYSKDFNSK